MERLGRWIPIAGWLPDYGRDDLPGDLIAGVTTAVMLIPQGMAYAMLAGLPPAYGLYASTVPLVVYAVFGSSRQLAVGPVAMVSLLTVSGVGALAEPGSAAYISHAIVLALMVGLVQFAMGVARLGMLATFLSHPVLSGFSSAAALIIGFSQLGQILGVDLERTHYVHETLYQAWQQIGATDPATLAVGLVSIAILVILRFTRPLVPAGLLVVVGGTLLTWALGLHEQGVAVVGEIPSGLPAFALPVPSWETLTGLAPTALTISLVAFMESIAVAKRVAAGHGEEADVDADQELVGLGLANLGGALFGSYPVTGGFSRTAVNDQAGAHSPLAGIVTAVVVVVALLFLTPLLYYLPKAVLAAIIMTAVFGLVDLAEVRHLWEVKPDDLALLALTFAVTLGVGIEQGILAGVGASLVWHAYKTTKPHIAVLGRIPGTTSYRNVLRHADARTVPGILCLRIDSQFYYGNVTFLRQILRDLEAEMEEPLRAVVLDASSVNQLDSSADSALHDIVDQYQARGVDLYLAKAKGPVLDVMQRSSLYQKLGEQHFTYRVHEAMLAAVSDKYEGAELETLEREDPRTPPSDSVPSMRKIVSVRPGDYPQGSEES